MKAGRAVNRAQDRARRFFALMAAAFLAVMLLGAAGHGAHHLSEQTPCDDCPVCLHLSAFARLAFGAPALFAAALYCRAQGLRVRGYGQLFWPMLALPTPVSEKIKLTI